MTQLRDLRELATWVLDTEGYVPGMGTNYAKIGELAEMALLLLDVADAAQAASDALAQWNASTSSSEDRSRARERGRKAHYALIIALAALKEGKE